MSSCASFHPMGGYGTRNGASEGSWTCAPSGGCFFDQNGVRSVEVLVGQVIFRFQTRVARVVPAEVSCRPL